MRAKNHCCQALLPSIIQEIEKWLWDVLQDAAEQEQADRLEVIPAQLLNNAAVLHMRGGESHAALALTKEAAQVCSA